MRSYLFCPRSLVGVFGLVAALLLGGAGCGKKREEAAPPPADPVPVRCPAGSVISAGACAPVVTAEKVQAVAQQRAKLEELAQLLAKSDVITAPAALLEDVRETALWKKLAATSERLASADQVMAGLGVAASELRGLKDQLGKASASLSDVERELQAVLLNEGRAQELAAVQEQVSRKLRELVGPLQRQVRSAVDKVGGPLADELAALGDKIRGACTLSKVTGGGGEAVKAACGKARDAFGQAAAFLVEVKDQPAAMFQDVTAALTGELGALVDDETRTAVSRAQTAIQAAAAAARQPRAATEPAGTAAPAPTAPTPSAPAPSAPSGPAAAPPPAAGGGALVSALGQPCGDGDACPSGASCKTYYGFAGPSGPAFKSCEVACGAAASGAVCPAGTACVTVADGPGSVCRAP